MKRKFIPVEEAFNRWKQNPEYVAAYDALEEEFALASTPTTTSKPTRKTTSKTASRNR